MRRLAPVLACLLLAGPALAAEKKEGGDKKLELQAVEVSPVGLPIVYKGRLVNYVFTTVRIDLLPGVTVAKEQQREPYYRDALVRLAHRTPFVDPKDLTRIDEAALRTAFLRDAGAIAGPRVIKAVVIVSQQPQRRTGLPKLDGVAPPIARPIIP